jgi:hypothetical protein
MTQDKIAATAKQTGKIQGGTLQKNIAACRPERYVIKN